MKELEFEFDNYTTCDLCGQEVKELFPYGNREVCDECLFDLDEDL